MCPQPEVKFAMNLNLCIHVRLGLLELIPLDCSHPSYSHLKSNHATSEDESMFGGGSDVGSPMWERKSSHGGDETGSEEKLNEKQVLERALQDELDIAKKDGGDVDTLVMKALLARVSAAGPNTAFKALASIEVRRLHVSASCMRTSGMMRAHVSTASM